MGSGTLYIVAGPIGNMRDITYRAVDILKSADVILSEDTRETAKILDSFQISKPQISYRDQNHDRVLPQILQYLQESKAVALVSDSGTPLISDPGFKLVRDVMRAGYKVVPIPGPSAVITALGVSSLPTDKFVYLGFLPKGPNQRKDLLKQYGQFDATLVVYESPFRVRKLLEEVVEVFGDRTVCLAGELTKMHEKIAVDKATNLLINFEKLNVKGEYVVLIAKEGY
ncbi:MAG TPA: 16S rRNA (cytidine(1402)-2'-O)-methyltransferase [Candidatus Saccharimonadales bacterium]|nr:16S rRNA (cytidine(1402)-2'-O)-methyltransferase [Candidatus Saccharimonadales bacterium]